MENIRRRQSISCVLLCIDSYEELKHQGRFYTVTSLEPIYFNDALQLCKSLEIHLTSHKIPQHTHEFRSFTKRKLQKNEVKIMMDNTILQQLPNEAGTKGTFVVHVQFRQNASWQGKIQWVDGKKSQSFRSTLEMLKLIDDALSATSPEPVTWNE